MNERSMIDSPFLCGKDWVRKTWISSSYLRAKRKKYLKRLYISRGISLTL